MLIEAQVVRSKSRLLNYLIRHVDKKCWKLLPTSAAPSARRQDRRVIN